jgi:iron complex transport system ATP-binding protein
MYSNESFNTKSFTMPVGKRKLAIPDLVVRPGEVVAVAGKNGAGKTVLLRHLMDWQEDQLIQKEGAWKRGDLRLAWLNTRREPYADLWVEDVVALGIVGQFDKNRFEAVIQEMSLHEIRHQSMNTISDGEWMRMMMARVMMQDAHIIIMDEPTAHLDFYYKRIWAQWIQKCSAESRVVICASHDETWIKTAQQIWWLNDSELCLYSGSEFSFDSLKKMNNQ